MSRRRSSPVRVVASGEKKVLAVVPSSVPQASRLAEEYADGKPGRKLLVKRGETVLARIDPGRP